MVGDVMQYLHDISLLTDETLDDLFAGLRAKGYKVVFVFAGHGREDGCYYISQPGDKAHPAGLADGSGE